MKNRLGYKKTTKTFFNIHLLVSILFAIFVFSLFFIRYIKGDDTGFHLANIVTRSKTLFNIPNAILPASASGLGYGTFLFYPPLPHTVGGSILFIISQIGFHAAAAIKIEKLLLIIFTSISMYFFVSKLFKNTYKGMMASIFYVSSSYFLTNFYMRDAFNECFVFLFMPLILLGLYYLFNENNKFKFYIFFVLGYYGLMYSHLVMAVWFTVFLVLGLIFFIKDVFKKDNFVSLLIASTLILIMTSTFTVPMIEHFITSEYAIEVQNVNFSPWVLDYKSFFIRMGQITLLDNILAVNFAPLVIVLFVFSIYKTISKKVSKEIVKYIYMFYLFSILAMSLTIIPSLWSFLPKFLYNIQFPWRLASFAAFGGSILAASSLDVLLDFFKSKYQKYVMFLLIIPMVVFFYDNVKYVHLYKEAKFAESDAFGWHLEYLPMNAYKNLEYFNNRNSDVILLNGSANINVISNAVPGLKFSAVDVKDATVEIPRLYYLGYEIKDGNGKELKYTNDTNGFISFKLSSDGVYTIKYVGTMGYRISLFVKSLTLIIIIALIVGRYIRYRKKRL